MAYERQTWEDFPSQNTPITADRLNHMEEGIEKANTIYPLDKASNGTYVFKATKTDAGISYNWVKEN